jgi:hypothetical protein
MAALASSSCPTDAVLAVASDLQLSGKLLQMLAGPGGQRGVLGTRVQEEPHPPMADCALGSQVHAETSFGATDPRSL